MLAPVQPLAALDAHSPAPIVCEATYNGYSAAYDQPENTIYLSPSVCARVRLLGGGARPRVPERRLELAYALEAVAHEEGHARGIPETAAQDGDRAATCYGIAHVPMIARELGASAGYAAALGAWSTYIREC